MDNSQGWLLRSLPAVYQEDPGSLAFLEKFLAIFELKLQESERDIARMPIYFDPATIPATKDNFKFLDWLASWLSLELYQPIGVERNRNLILAATKLYEIKGTCACLERLGYLLTGRTCRVKEYVNNVFRSYGMEQCLDAKGSAVDCSKFLRKVSKTLDTSDPALMEKMGTYNDEVHYIWDSSSNGLYSPYNVELYITVLGSDDYVIDDKYARQLNKIIEPFLPTFIKLHISVIALESESSNMAQIEESYLDSITAPALDSVAQAGGIYSDSLVWETLTWNGQTRQNVPVKTIVVSAKKGDPNNVNNPEYHTYIKLWGDV